MPKVLIVDDDRTMVTLLRTLLELDGFKVANVAHGAMVLPASRSEKPDVVLMDVHLADADGLEILRHIRADAELAKLRVVISSGLDMSLECEKAGGNAFILKPYPPDQLASTLKKVLES
ncbi:MAG: response regulator [Chloroflexi bacterium]|nr:response regulator [Chloroflexota bacterium]